MSLSKEGYVPSTSTLTSMDNFGLKTRKHKLSKPNLALTRSQAKFVPNFAGKARGAFDKENLLEQLRQEKIKHREMSACNGILKRQISQSKQPAPQLTISVSATISGSLKREIQLLVQQVEQKQREIERIKTSKKYNRFIELQCAKQVYIDQIRTVETKIRNDRSALRQQKRILRDQRRRERDVAAMNKEVEINIVQQSNELLDKVEGIDIQIRMGLQKEIEQRRQKSRLIQEVLDLQQKTGKMYIVNAKEDIWEEPQEEAVAFKRDAILKDVTEKYDDSSSSQPQDDTSEEQVSRRRLNVSY